MQIVPFITFLIKYISKHYIGFDSITSWVVFFIFSDILGCLLYTEIDVFLELSCFFDDTVDVGNLISGSFAFSKTNLNIWKFTVHELLKPGLENFEHYFTSV